MLLKLKSHIKTHKLIIGDFKTPLSSMDKSSGQKLNKTKMELADFMNQMNLTNIGRTF